MFGRDSKAGSGIGNFIMKKGRLQAFSLTAGMGHEEVGSRLTRSRASNRIKLGTYMAFSDWH